MSWSVWVRLTLRSSSRGAAAKMSAAIHGVEAGSSYHWMNDVMPAWATSPTADRRAGGISAYHGSVSSRRLMVAVARSPAMRRSQASVSALSIVGVPALTGRSALPAGAAAGACVDVVQAVLLDRLGREARVRDAVLGERLKRAHDDRRSVDLEPPPGGRTRVREPEVVRTERDIAVRHPRTDLVLHRVHEVADGDHRSVGAPQLLRQVRGAALLAGVQEVVVVGGQAVAAQLGPRGDRPHVGHDAP